MGGIVCCIESVTALSDDIDDEEIAGNSFFLLGGINDFQRLAGPRNVSVDWKYDVLYF